MGRATRNVAGVGFALVLALLVGNAVVTGRNLWTVYNNQGRVSHARQVVIQLGRALSLIKDAETSQRGYLLTGRDEYLAPYRSAADGLGRAMDRLDSLITDSPRQRARVGDLRRLTDEKMAELEQTIALRREKGLDAALGVVTTNQGKKVMDQIEKLAAAMEGEEDRLLTQRIKAFEAAFGRTITAFGIATGLALLLLLAVFSLKQRDDAEQERNAEVLRQEREWLATTLASIGDAVLATDGKGCVRLLNPVAASLTGWTQEDAAGRLADEVFRIVNEVTRKAALNPVARVIQEGRVIGLANHTVVVARDGTETPIEDSAAPIKDKQGRVVGVVMVFRDVTRERAAQRLVQETSDRMRMAIESAGVGTWDFNPHTGELSWDERCRAIYGVRPGAQDSYDTFLGAVHADDRQRVADLVKKALEPTGDGEFTAEYRTAGNWGNAGRWVSARGRAYFEEHGWAIRFIGTVLDITEAKRAADELQRAKEEAEEANRSKDQFLAVLSHELRTPLNPILLAVTSMLERPTPAEEVRPNLEMIRLYVNLQARLIDDLLDVMRIVRGKMPLHWEVADCHTLIREAVQICQSEVFGKELVLELALEAPHHHINADPARLQQVFWNLIKNAVKFSPEGGRIAIRTRNAVDTHALGDRLIIEVSDTGIGIEPDVLPLIFDPFKQGESSITRRFGGMGLGLAIGKGIVEGHGGLLSARSDGMGRGSTFQIELRALPQPKSDDGGVPSESGLGAALPPTAPRKILLVEDEPATLRLMHRLLQRLGHDVTTADTLKSALQALDGTAFELVISDIGLPDGTGLELMRQVVTRRGPTPAIALTGYGMEEDIQRSREAGFTAHLTKPIDFIKLEIMIHQVAKLSS